MIADDLTAIGFARRDGELRAPDGARVTVTPLDSRCLRFKIELSNGNALHFVVAQVAIKIEEPAP